jgi:transcriptional regulator with XRE-family HTH domain
MARTDGPEEDERASEDKASVERQHAYAVERVKIARAFGRHLRMLRKADGYSQDSLARATRLHRTQISLLERGERAPGLLTILILADALWITPDVLLEGLPTPKERRSANAKNGRRAYVITGEKEQLRLLGLAIRSVRETRDSTIEGLARAVGIPSEELQAIEAGELDPDYELLLRLAECLNTRPSAFVVRAEELGGRPGG